MDAASPEGNQCINRNVEDAGRLAQARLRSCEVHSIGILKAAAFLGNKKGGQIALPASCCARQSQPGRFSLYLVARLCVVVVVHLLIRLRVADVSADGILAYLVGYDLFVNTRARNV